MLSESVNAILFPTLSPNFSSWRFSVISPCFYTELSDLLLEVCWYTDQLHPP